MFQYLRTDQKDAQIIQNQWSVGLIMRSKRVFGKKKVTKRQPVGVDHEADCSEKRGMSTPDDPIPIPSVTEVPNYWDDECGYTEHFSRPQAYIKHEEDELSYALTRRSANYDMDDEDEEWLSKFSGVGNKGFGSSLSYETFELIIDAFEKAFFCCPDEYTKHDSQVPVGCLCYGMCSEDVAAAVYGYWLKKRKRRKAALVRIFEAHKVNKRRGRRKKCSQLEGEQGTASGTMKPVAGEDALQAEKHDIIKLAAAKEAATRLGDLAVKKRNEAQSIVTKADLLMYGATMALRIAEEAQIRESLNPGKV